ncbi:MAG: Ig-like domain-containing protein [Chloroflexota bacterium]
MLEGPPATIVGASSTLNNSPSFAPERAIDDFSNTDWVSARGSDEWIMVDLGGDLFTIDRVRLMAGNFTQAPDAFEIRASTTTSDQNAFTTVFSGNGAATTAIQEFAFAPVEARYVQLYVYGVHGADQVNLSTLEVLTAHGQNAAKASGVGAFVVDASSELGSSTVGSRVIDFSQTTTWATASGQNTNQWVKIGLLGGQTYRIDRVQLRGHNLVNAPRDFEIRVSTTGTDDADFATVFSGTLPSDDLLHWFTFPPVEAKFVQIFILNTHGGANVQMNTFRVFSPDLGGMVVPFRDRSTDDAGSITDWLWDLGDGNSSTEQHPIHTYEIAGTYAVKLTVTNTNGVTDTAQMDYFAQPAPVADFTMNPDPPHEGVGNDFTDASTTPDGQLMGWAWTFTEEEKRTEQNPTNVFFPDNGEYPVELQVTDSRFLVQTIVRPINVINLPPTMLGAVGPTPVPWGIGWLFSPKPNDVLADIPTLRCDWDYDDNTTLAIENCATLENFATEKAYDQPGDYNPTITVTDKDGGTVSVSKVVNVTKHKSYLNILARSLDEDAEQVELEVRLWDADGPWKNPTWAPLANKSVEISTDVQNTTVTTDENGVAIASMTYGSNPFTITANFVEDALYQATNDTLVINTEQTLPKGDIIFVIDESTSMGDEQDDVKERVNEMAAQLAGRIDYQLGLVGFGAGILGNGGNSPHTHGLTYHDGNGRIHQPLTHDAAEFQNAIDELNVVGGREPGFQATAFAMQDIHGFRPTAAVCVVLITDEDATENIWEGGSETREDAIAALSTRNATFFAVADLDYLDVPRDYGIIPGSLTQATGGQPFEIEDFREDASAVLSAIIDQCSLRVEEQVLPDLAVSIDDGSEAVAAGEHITYTITVSNNIGMASNIVLTDRLPAEVIFLSASHGGSVNAGRVTWPDFTLTNGGSTSRTVTVQVNESLPTGVDTLTNTVEAFDQTYDVPELNEANNVATLATQVILNQAPVAVADTFSVNEDSESNLLDVLNNDSDPDGDTLTIDAVSAAINGTVAIADSTLHYTPTANVNGIETITYTISDGSISATAAITITIQSVNDAPLAVGDVASLVQDTSVTIDLLTNDSDIEGDSLSVTSISQPGNGTNARNADETVTYTPTVGFVGEDSFTYTVEDGNGGGATATVTVTVLPFHLDVCPLYPIGLPTVRLDGVQPGDQVDEIISGSQHPDWYLYLSWNGDYGYHALIDSLTPPGTSHLYINPNSASDVVLSVGDWVQAWPYIANDSNVEAALDAAIAEPYLIMPVWDEITGADFGIQYHVSRFARVRLLEYALPDRDRIWIEYIGDVTCGAGDLLNSIEAVNDTFTVGEDSVGNLLDVLTNDSDSTGSTLTIDAVGNASNGTVSIVANTLVYTPNVDFAGTEDFIYTVSNASGESETANVAVVVTPANDAPIAADDRFSVVPDSVDNVLDVLANDNDVDGDALTIVLVNQPATGTTAISGTSILFTPAISSTETVTFSYTMEDGYGGSATADVTVEVESPQAENCQLYPIGLPITRMAGLNPGDLVDEIISGSQHNEWYLYLSWNGDYGYQALIDSLTPPGTSHLYSNPNDASDTVLSVGDWVQAWPYIANDGNVAAALDAAIDEPSLIMPIWDVITGSDFDIQYQIAGFARVRLLSYTFPDRDRIWIEYLGEVACDDAAVTSAQISVPRQAESKVLNTTEIGSEVGEAFTDRETEDGEPMNPIVANAGGVTLGVSQMQLQSIYLPLVTALREPEMDVHSATLSLKLYLPLSSR